MAHLVSLWVWLYSVLMERKALGRKASVLNWIYLKAVDVKLLGSWDGTMDARGKREGEGA